MTTQKRNFDLDAAQWDIPPRVQLSKEIVAAILKKNTFSSSDDIMDFGAGSGLLTMQFSPIVRSVTAVDSSKGMLDTLAKKVESVNVTNVKVSQKDPDTGDKLEGSFDAIISNMTLHHIQKVENLISEFYRVLKAGGKVFLADLDLDDGLFHSDNTGVFHFGFDRESLKKIFRGAGFKNVEIETATSITKPAGNSQEMRKFTIFLIQCEK